MTGNAETISFNLCMVEERINVRDAPPKSSYMFTDIMREACDLIYSALKDYDAETRR